MKFNLTHKQLKDCTKQVYSQSNQDGVLEAIFNQLEIEKGLCVEFGAGANGLHISNTANLRLNHGWEGVLMDAEPLAEIVQKEFITAENINKIFDKYRLAYVDYLSIDCDSIDYFIWQALDYNPKVVSIEFNSKFRNDESYAIEYNPEHKWDGTDYYSASLLALKRLGEKKGYTLVHVVENLDAFFIKNDLIDENYIAPTLDEIFPETIICFEKSNKQWVIV